MPEYRANAPDGVHPDANNDQQPDQVEQRLDHDAALAVGYAGKELREEAALLRGTVEVFTAPEEGEDPREVRHTKLEKLLRVHRNNPDVIISDAAHIVKSGEFPDSETVEWMAESAAHYDQRAEEIEHLALNLHNNPPSEDFTNEYNGGEPINEQTLQEWQWAIDDITRMIEDAKRPEAAMMELQAQLDKVKDDPIKGGEDANSILSALLLFARQKVSVLQQAALDSGSPHSPIREEFDTLQQNDATTIGDLKDFITRDDVPTLQGYLARAQSRLAQVMDGSAVKYESKPQVPDSSGI